jgi:hypothetical protein
MRGGARLQGVWHADVASWKGPMADPLRDPIFSGQLIAKKVP